MNFLAHAYLSGDDHKVLVGNFIGDFVKGKAALARFEKRIVTGIELHRVIDLFTDTHEIVGQSKNRLRPKYRHYAAVIVDVFYDHFLARNWSAYHHVPLKAFTERVYRVVSAEGEILPSDFRYMLQYMSSGNWLLNYASTQGIHRALSGMSQRTPYESKMEQAVDDLDKHYAEFKEEFEAFFPLLRKHCADFLQTR